MLFCFRAEIYLHSKFLEGIEKKTRGFRGEQCGSFTVYAFARLHFPCATVLLCFGFLMLSTELWSGVHTRRKKPVAGAEEGKI